MSEFKVGDVIIHKSNPVAKAQKVVRVPSNTEYDYAEFCTKYLHNNKDNIIYRYTINNYKLYETESNETTMSEVKTLYSFPKTDGSSGYGIHIGTNSQNKYLIEEKGTGEIHVLDKESLEEVLPYTYSVRYNGNGSEYHFIGEPRTVAKGDFLIQSPTSSSNAFQLVQVANVDTKSRKATKRFNGVKVLTQPI